MARLPEPAELIAVARITGPLPHRPDWFRVTVGGDGLEALKPGAEIVLYRPAYRGNDLKRILASVTPHPGADGLLLGATLRARSIGDNRKGRVKLILSETQQAELAALPETEQDLSGWWLCCSRAGLVAAAKGRDVYVFQLLGLEVFGLSESGERGTQCLARVTGYLETGAHGVLETRMEQDDVEVLVPFVPEYSELDLEAGRVYVRDFDALIP